MKLMRCVAQRALFSVVLMAVAGCGTKVVEPEAPKPVVRSIAVLPIDAPDKAYSENLSPAAGVLYPGWIQWLDNRAKTEIFAAQLDKDRREFGQVMTTSLVDELVSEGFEVNVLNDAPRFPEDPSSVDYSRIDTEAAVLHVWFEDLAMHSGGLSRYYVPRVNVSAFMTFPKADDSLYYETIYYGADSRNELSYWGIPSDPNDKFLSFEEMTNRPADVSNAFRRGIRAVARHLATELKRQFDSAQAER